jgi:hypothetical protein
MDQKIKITPISKLGTISFLKGEIACIEEFNQKEDLKRINIFLKNGMAVSIENENATDFAETIFNSNSPNMTIFVDTARLKKAERTLSFQL